MLHAQCDRERHFFQRTVSNDFRSRTGDEAMKRRVQLRHDAHARALGVCAEHSAVFDATAGGQKTRAALATHVADVTSLLALQEQSMQDGRTAVEQCRLSRRTLRDAANGVVKIGKLANLDDAMVATLQLPGKVRDEELLAYARALLNRVSAHVDALVAEGLPPDLLQHLDGAIQAFAAAKEAQAASRERFAAASTAIRDTLDQADKTVGALEAIVVNTPPGNPQVLTKLRVAKRVGPRTTPPAPVNPTPAPTPPPAPAEGTA
jgi:hypothetical protein